MMSEDNKTADKPTLQEEISFVARHYSHGALSADKAWRDMRLGRDTSARKRWWVAAAVATALTASAALVIINSREPSVAEPAAVETPVAATQQSTATVEDISVKYADTPVSTVVAAIERSCGVTVTGLPESDPHITLDYTGSAEEIVDAINESTGLNLKVER